MEIFAKESAWNILRKPLLNISALSQIASALGAILILAGYFGLQLRRFNETDLFYLHLNFFGAFLLLLAALKTGQFGFVVLEGTWVGVTVYGYVRRKRQKS